MITMQSLNEWVVEAIELRLAAPGRAGGPNSGIPYPKISSEGYEDLRHLLEAKAESCSQSLASLKDVNIAWRTYDGEYHPQKMACIRPKTTFIPKTFNSSKNGKTFQKITERKVLSTYADFS